MSQTRDAIGSAQALAEQMRAGNLDAVEDVKEAIEEVCRSAGMSPWLVVGLARDYLRHLEGTEVQRELLSDAIKLFPIKVEPDEDPDSTAK